MPAYSCWSCVKDARYLHRKGKSDVKEAWWDALDMSEETDSDCSDQEENPEEEAKEEVPQVASEETKTLQVKVLRLVRNDIIAIIGHTLKKKITRCPECKKKFPRNPPMLRHVRSQHPKCVICGFCNTVFQNNAIFKVHSELCKKPLWEFACTMCDRRCSKEGELRLHVKMKHEKIDCQKCGKHVGNYLNLSRHSQMCK